MSHFIRSLKRATQHPGLIPGSNPAAALQRLLSTSSVVPAAVSSESPEHSPASASSVAGPHPASSASAATSTAFGSSRVLLAPASGSGGRGGRRNEDDEDDDFDYGDYGSTYNDRMANRNTIFGFRSKATRALDRSSSARARRQGHRSGSDAEIAETDGHHNDHHNPVHGHGRGRGRGHGGVSGGEGGVPDATYHPTEAHPVEGEGEAAVAGHTASASAAAAAGEGDGEGDEMYTNHRRSPVSASSAGSRGGAAAAASGPSASHGHGSDRESSSAGGSSSGSSSGSGGRSKDLVPHGMNAPKLSTVIALPSATRPLFPGLYYPIVIKDEALVRTLVEERRKGLPYVGLFLKKVIRDDDFLKNKARLDSVMPDQPSIPLTGSGEGEGEGEGDGAVTAVSGEHYSMDDLHRIGTFAQVYRISKLDRGGYSVILVGLRRIEALGVREDSPHLRLHVRHIDEPTAANRRLRPDLSPRPEAEVEEEERTIKAYSTEIIATLKECIKNGFIFHEQLSFLLNNVDWANPATLADVCATFTTADAAQLQEVLAATDVVDRLHKTLVLLRKEVELSRMQQDLSKQMAESMRKIHRKNMLHEQLKHIKKELGLEKEDKEELGAKFSERLKGKTVPAEVKSVFDDELLKLGRLEQSSMEFNLTRNYLDWLSALPWGVHTEQTFDLKHAETVLNEDHYGLEDIKDRILEFIAVGKLLGHTPQGKIMLFVGPPGVGKTSIGKSIARALGREFYRFSVGGMSDVAEIKGHRRTYVGAMPGKLVQALKKTGCSNPVILIDEVDKLGRGGNHGDPSSALLEVLDPEQNNSFLDHYLDVPLDLSKVLFLCTANVAEAIPGPLLDRMDVIRLSGYVTQEKEHIAKHYLVPTVRSKLGIAPDQASLTPGAVVSLIKSYCREAGVRNLQKQIEKVFRRVAFSLVKGTPAPIVVGARDLPDYLGQQVYSAERLYPRTPVGVVMGLAWSSSGGAVLYLESELSDAVRAPAAAVAAAADATAAAEKEGKGEEEGKVTTVTIHNTADEDKDDSKGGERGRGSNKVRGGPGNGALHVTGQLGDVMKESSSIAYTIAKSYLGKLAAEAFAIAGPAASAGTDSPSAASAAAVGDAMPVPVTETEPLMPLHMREPRLRPPKRMTVADSVTKVPTDITSEGGITAPEAAEAAAAAAAAASQPASGKTQDAAAAAPVDPNIDVEDEEEGFAPVPSALPPATPLDPSKRWYVPVPSPTFFADHHIHVHFPQGAVPKDGPSAGIALVCCLLSQALGRPLVPDLAMTGEITLTGKVLPIGGVKEKVIAAKRAGVRHIIAPLANLKDFAELPSYVSEGITVYFADSYDEVFRVAFGAPFSLAGATATPMAVKVFPPEDTASAAAEAVVVSTTEGTGGVPEGAPVPVGGPAPPVGADVSGGSGKGSGTGNGEPAGSTPSV